MKRWIEGVVGGGKEKKRNTNPIIPFLKKRKETQIGA